MSSRPGLELLAPKLDSIARCIERIESKLPLSLEILERDFDLQDILTLNIERAVQQAVDIAMTIVSRSSLPVPGEMAECFTALERLGWIDSATSDRMKKSVGFRNLAVHEYEKINWAIVHAIATKHLDDLRSFARQIAEKAENTEEGA